MVTDLERSTEEGVAIGITTGGTTTDVTKTTMKAVTMRGERAVMVGTGGSVTIDRVARMSTTMGRSARMTPPTDLWSMTGTSMDKTVAPAGFNS